MLGGKNNPLPVIPDENRFHYHSDASNQLQLFGNCELSDIYLACFLAHFVKCVPCFMIGLYMAFHPSQFTESLAFSISSDMMIELNIDDRINTRKEDACFCWVDFFLCSSMGG